MSERLNAEVICRNNGFALSRYCVYSKLTVSSARTVEDFNYENFVGKRLIRFVLFNFTSYIRCCFSRSLQERSARISVSRFYGKRCEVGGTKLLH